MSVSLPACRGGGSDEPLVTYVSAVHRLSVRHPATWKTDEAEQEGVWYRYFLGPPGGPQRKPSVSVTLLVGPLAGTVDEYARSYLTGNTLAASRDESRGSARGKSYLFSSSDGQQRYSLLLVADAGKVYGLYAQGDASNFERNYQVLEEMARSLTLEKSETWPERRDEKFGFALRVPASWRESRAFSGGGKLVVQFTSPPLAADKGGQTVHSLLAMSVEPLADKGGIETWYRLGNRRLGESFQLLSHAPWQGGYRDDLKAETSIAESRIRRYYRATADRGYCLAFESRDDVYPRAREWYDLIAMTLKIGPELSQP